MSATTMKLAPARRVVSKAFDGTAAITALIVNRCTGREFARMVMLAEGLLDYDVPQVDIHDVTGIPQKVISALFRMRGHEISRAGRWPTTIDKALTTPMRHMRMSVFLGAIEKLEPELKSGKIVSGEVLLAALRHTSMVCGPAADDDVGSRYHIIAIHQLAAGTLYMKTCPKCRVRSVRTDEDVRINGVLRVGISISCPKCEIDKGRLVAASKRAASAATMGADSSGGLFDGIPTRQAQAECSQPPQETATIT